MQLPIDLHLKRGNLFIIRHVLAECVAFSVKPYCVITLLNGADALHVLLSLAI